MNLVLLSGEKFNHGVHEGKHKVTQRKKFRMYLVLSDELSVT